MRSRVLPGKWGRIPFWRRIVFVWDRPEEAANPPEWGWYGLGAVRFPAGVGLMRS